MVRCRDVGSSGTTVELLHFAPMKCFVGILQSTSSGRNRGFQCKCNNYTIVPKKSISYENIRAIGSSALLLYFTIDL